MNILIAHPTRQHAHKLAAGLQDAGNSVSFWTLLPDRRSMSWWPSALDIFVPKSVFRHSLGHLNHDQVSVLFGPLYFQKCTAVSRNSQVRDFGEWVAWLMFDRWVASRLRFLRPDLVIGYEMCSSMTFKVAKTLGIRCFLDAAACHYQWVDSCMPTKITGKNTLAGRKMRARKDSEIRLADTIICTSELALNTYKEAGVEETRLSLNTPGCDKAMFFPPKGSIPKTQPKFIFVGQPTYHKGFDLLAQAFCKVIEEFPEAELLVAGAKELSVVKEKIPRVRFLGKLSQKDIRLHLWKSDCLLLPSRCESFGMVVLEALSSGVPVVVSEHAGSSMLVRDSINGWVVRSGVVEDLYEHMRRCCKNPQAIRAMSKNCVQSVAHYDWRKYSKRANQLISG
jgi:glycosyltransferase involved in cell wall biosynthesis